MSDAALVLTVTGICICIVAALVAIQMQSRATRRKWRKMYLEAKAYNDEYERRVLRDGWIATALDPPEPLNYTITYRTPCTFCGREAETTGVETTVRRFSTRGPEPKRKATE